MTPVFFRRVPCRAANLPNLTYMLAFDDEAQQTKAWNAFLPPRRRRVEETSKDEAYKDVVSNITNLILRPGAGSQCKTLEDFAPRPAKKQERQEEKCILCWRSWREAFPEAPGCHRSRNARPAAPNRRATLIADLTMH